MRDRYEWWADGWLQGVRLFFFCFPLSFPFPPTYAALVLLPPRRRRRTPTDAPRPPPAAQPGHRVPFDAVSDQNFLSFRPVLVPFLFIVPDGVTETGNVFRDASSAGSFVGNRRPFLERTRREPPANGRALNLSLSFRATPVPLRSVPFRSIPFRSIPFVPSNEQWAFD